MAVEDDTVHVEHFALVPVQPLEYRGGGLDRLAGGGANPEADTLAVLQRVELGDEVEAAGEWLSVIGCRLSGVLTARVVDCEEIERHGEGQLVALLQGS